jgi:hypothetical protein
MKNPFAYCLLLKSEPTAADNVRRPDLVSHTQQGTTRFAKRNKVMLAFVWWCMTKGSLEENCVLAEGVGCLQLQDMSSAVKVEGAAFSGISAHLYQTIPIHAIFQLSS